MASFKKVLVIFTIATMVRGDDQDSPAVDGRIARAPPQADLTTPMVWIDGAIKKHNEYRARHGSNPLVFDKTLAEIAQAWANEIAKTNVMEHSKEAQKAKLGENLYMFKSSADLTTKQQGPEEAVKAWYDEIKDYDFVKGGPKGKAPIGHFTQVVWKGSAQVGTAYNKTLDGNWHVIYVVANYNPAGNYLGQFQANVVPSGCRGNHLITGATLASLLVGGILTFAYMY